jgi:hypothetical protein
MKDLLRRGDPAFYDKEPILLRTGVQIPRYDEEAQLEARLKVLKEDRTLHRVTVVVALIAFVAVSGIGILGARGDWPALCAFAVIALAVPRALPWWPEDDERTTWRIGIAGFVLIILCSAWARFDFIIGGFALASAVALVVARGRNRLVLIILAVAVLFAHALIITPVPAILAGGLVAVSGAFVAREWRRRSQVVPFAAFAVLLFGFAYGFAFDARALALHVPLEIAAIAIAYFGVGVIAARIRRADVLARPEGLISLPQTVVPLLDRSHHHAIICWRV